MASENRSVFFSSIRSFFIALFTILGISVGIFIVVLVLTGIVGTNKEPVYNYDYIQFPDEKGQRLTTSVNSPVILSLNIEGTIGSEQLNADTIVEQLQESQEGIMAKRIKGLLLHINTPGGTVLDANKIYVAIKDYKDRHKIPVYAFVDGLCASGGMYVACAADRIYATDVSIIGSVGVYGRYFNIASLMNKVGVKCLTLKAGKDKDALSPFDNWEAGEEANDQSLVNFYYNHFVDLVTANRPKITREALTQTYGAQVFVAHQAQEYGYIDEISPDYTLCMAELARESKIGVNEAYQVFGLESSNWLPGFVKTQFASFSGKIVHQIQIDGQLPLELNNKLLYYYQP